MNAGHRFQILLLVILSTDLAVGLEIVAHPSSLLVPINEIAVFTCKARSCFSCSGYWVINSSYTEVPDEFIAKGFTFPPMQNDSDELLMTLLVNASEVINNSVISCEFDPSGGRGSRIQSRRATLLVIANSPLSCNPVLVKNTTHVTVSWSPPFLWPGQPIEYYNVSLAIESNGSVTSQRVNSNFSDHVVSYTQQMSVKSSPCSSFTFHITAADLSGSTFQTFNITFSSSQIKFPPSAINGSVQYVSDGIPALLEVYLQLPNSTCTLNYTLFIEDVRGIVVEQFGPFPHPGSAIVKRDIAISDLKRDQVYALIARADLYSKVTFSNKVYFNTSLKSWDHVTNIHPTANENGNADAYKAATAISLALAIVTLLAMGFVIIIIYVRHKHTYSGTVTVQEKYEESKQRIQESMVPNPIYDGDGNGPVYDSIRPQYETLVAVAPQRFTETHQSSGVIKSSHSNDEAADVVRYQSVHQLPQFRSQSSGHTIADAGGGSASGSYCNTVSLYSPRMMALKKNGQERNKLHLPISLDGSNASHGHSTEVPHVPMSATAMPVVPAEPVEESYMIMNSAHTALSNAGCVPQSDA